MKKWFIALFTVLILLATGFIALRVKAASVAINFLNVSEGQVINLNVGENYVFQSMINSDEQFIYAMMLSDEQFPGRGVTMNGNDIVKKATTALLFLTATGKESTADLPGGVAPVALVVGVRFPGGVVVSERVDFFIQVP